MDCEKIRKRQRKEICFLINENGGVPIQVKVHHGGNSKTMVILPNKSRKVVENRFLVDCPDSAMERDISNKAANECEESLFGCYVAMSDIKLTMDRNDILSLAKRVASIARKIRKLMQ